jgi:DNA adenine methylase
MKQFPLKTCLRYPGGKSKALKTLAPWFPTNFKEFREPFLGGGSISLLVTQNYPNIPIWVNDKYFYLYNFWVQLRDNGEELSNKLRSIKQEILGDDAAHKQLFETCQKEIINQIPSEQAVSFFIMNKCSYSGLTENSTFSVQASKSNFSLIGIDKLPAYSNIIKNWKITNIDYSEVMNASGEDVFVFLDPPYDIKDFLYGTGRKLHSSFSHQRFADDVDQCPHKFMITYNVNDWLVERYKNYYKKEWKLRYSMVHRGEKGTDENVKTELLVTNYDVDGSDSTTINLLNFVLDV